MTYRSNYVFNLHRKKKEKENKYVLLKIVPLKNDIQVEFKGSISTELRRNIQNRNFCLTLLLMGSFYPFI